LRKEKLKVVGFGFSGTDVTLLFVLFSRYLASACLCCVCWDAETGDWDMLVGFGRDCRKYVFVFVILRCMCRGKPESADEESLAETFCREG
jgi:hypothetical protein